MRWMGLRVLPPEALCSTTEAQSQSCLESPGALTFLPSPSVRRRPTTGWKTKQQLLAVADLLTSLSTLCYFTAPRALVEQI